MPESSLVPEEGEAPPQPVSAAPAAAEWRTLAELSSVEEMSFALNHENARMHKLQREALDRREIRNTVEMLVANLEHVEQQTVQAQQMQQMQVQQYQAQQQAHHAQAQAQQAQQAQQA